MLTKQLVLLLTFVVVVSPLGTQAFTTPQNTAAPLNTNIVTTTATLYVQLFANKQFITAGDTVQISFDVYDGNFTMYAQQQVTFTFGSMSFTKVTGTGLTNFTMVINSTYSQVDLTAHIKTDQKTIQFYDLQNQPICQTNCKTANIYVSQLQVFSDFNASFMITIQSNVQWFTATDMIEAQLQGLGLVMYLQVTNTSYYGSNQLYSENFTIQFSVPIIQPGLYAFTYTYYSSSYEPLTVSDNFTIANSAIPYTLTNSSVDRLNIGESPKDFVTYQFGFDVANFQYKYYITSNATIAYSTSGSLQNILLRVPIDVPFYDNVGQYFLNLEVSKNNVILYTKLIPITVYDNIITNLLFNNQVTDTSPSIQFQLTTYIEDTLVTIPTNVTIINADTNQTLKSMQAGSTQYFTLSFANVSVLPKELLVYTTSSYTYYRGSVKTYPIYFKEQTTISSNFNQAIQLERLQTLQLKTAVVKTATNTSVTSGLVDLSIDSTIIQTINLTTTNTFTYVLPISYVVGEHSLTLSYLGTANLLSSTISYKLYIYSNVHFTDVKVNNTFTNPTTPILVTGYVKDENNTGVITKVALFDSTNTIIDQTVTTADGQFSFIVLNKDVLGYYDYTLKALAVNYYKSASYQFNLLQNNAFSVSIKANQTMSEASITVKGDIYGVYQLSYYTTGSKQFNITELNLDSSGIIQTSFLTPNILGPLYFNVTNEKNPRQTIILQATLYKDPNIIITQINTAYVGQKVNITIQSGVAYDLFLNNKLLTDQSYFINKTLVSMPMETKGLNQIKVVCQSDYVTTSQIVKEIFVYEKVNLIENLPAKINENTNVTTYLQVVNSQNVPLGYVHIEFLYKGNVLLNETTDNKGYLKTYITIKDDIANYKFRILEDKAHYINQYDYPVDAILIRTLTVTSNINTVHFNDLTGTMVSFTVTYKNTGRPAPLVNMTVEIINQKQQKKDYNLKTSNNGVITLQIQEPVGKYVLTVITTNPNYIMSKAVYNFTVEGFNVVNNPFLIPTILISLAGIVVIVRKRVIK